MWRDSSCSESFRLLVWQAENTTSGQGSSRERSPVGSRFSGLLFLDVPRKATEQVRTCGFRKNSLSLDKAPKMHDSVRLTFRESFLVTLPSIFSETWVMYSSAIPGLSVLCDWLFLVFSGVSLETAANFLLFINVAIILREELCQLWKLNWVLFFLSKCLSPLSSGKKFQPSKNSYWCQKYSTIPTGSNLNTNISSFVSPNNTFSLAGNIVVYRPSQGVNREKVLLSYHL